MTRILIRPSSADDLPALTAIYGWHVRHGTGTFEIDPPTLDDMVAETRQTYDGPLQFGEDLMCFEIGG